MSDFVCFLYNWQTLIGSCLAIVAGAFGIRATIIAGRLQAKATLQAAQEQSDATIRSVERQIEENAKKVRDERRRSLSRSYDHVETAIARCKGILNGIYERHPEIIGGGNIDIGITNQLLCQDKRSIDEALKSIQSDALVIGGSIEFHIFNITSNSIDNSVMTTLAASTFVREVEKELRCIGEIIEIMRRREEENL